METEKPSHETKEGLLLAQSSPAHQNRHLISKLQNGAKPPEVPSHQVNGDAEWYNVKPGAAISQMKKNNESCPSPTGIQKMFDHSWHSPNGEVKHEVGDQPPKGDSKKIRADSEINGSEVKTPENSTVAWDKPAESIMDCYVPEKKTCNFPNGDIFSISRNKQMPISNGATVTCPTAEGTPGELLEKTLSQYYPDHVSIAPQSCADQQNALERPCSSVQPRNNSHSPSLTSALSVSPQTSHPGHGELPQKVDVNYAYRSPSAMNGYSSQFCAKHQQKQQTLPYSLHEVPVSENSCSAYGSSEDLDSEGWFSHHTMTQSSSHIQKQSMQEIKQDYQSTNGPTFTPKPEVSSRLKTFAEGRVTESNVSEKSQHALGAYKDHEQAHYETQQANGPPDGYKSEEQTPLGSVVLSPKPSLIQNHDLQISNGLSPQLNSGDSYKHGTKTNNKGPIETRPAVTLMQADASCEVGWIDLNSSLPPHTSRHNAPSWKRKDAQLQQGSFDQVKKGSSQSSAQQDEQVQVACNPRQTQDQFRQTTTANWRGANGAEPIKHFQKNIPIKNSPSYKAPERSFTAQSQNKHLGQNNQDVADIIQAGLPHQQLSQVEGHAPYINQYVRDVTQHQNRGEGQLKRELISGVQEEHKRPEQRNSDHKCRITPGPELFNGHALRNTGNSLQLAQLPKVNSSISLYKDANDSVAFQRIRQMQLMQQPRLQNPSALTLPQLPQPQPQLPHGALGQQVTEPTQLQSETSLVSGHLLSDQQRHASLRMHLLHKQRNGHSSNVRESLIPQRIIKTERESPGLETALPVNPQEKNSCIQSTMKQEPIQSPCGQRQKNSMTDTREDQPGHSHPFPIFERKSCVMKSPDKIKVESSGQVTILSTTTNLGGVVNDEAAAVQKSPSDFTPTRKVEPSLSSFIESPMKLLETPIKNLLDTPSKTQYEIPSCYCVEQISEKDEGPYYTHLGTAPNVAAIRQIMEKRFGQTGKAIRIEKVIYTGKEGKSTQGCPVAKWVIRRSSEEEKLLVLVRERAGHTCETACLIVAILIWEGISTSLADRLYIELSETLRQHGALTNRKCAHNEQRTCACQGLDPEVCGASYSFGCSWSMYYNGCKFARSKIPRKFRLLGDDSKEEERLEQNLQNLATIMAPTYKKLAPDAYGNQVEYEERAPDCRLGLKEGRPFSGVTACLDFCAHAHRDLHNMQSGSTVVCTLTREDNREIGKIPEDEQLHVLPLYIASPTDEFGSVEAQQEKMKSGAIQVLSTFRSQVRMLAEPAKSCRQKKLESRKANKASNPDTTNSKVDKSLQTKLKQNTFDNFHNGPGLTNGSHPPQGKMGIPQAGHSLHHQQAQNQTQQHNLQQSCPLPYPASHQSAGFPQFTNQIDHFTSTSQPASMIYSQSTPSGSPFPDPLHASNTYVNGSHSANPYPSSPLKPGLLYPGYQTGGNLTLDGHHHSNLKQFEMYRLQKPGIYPGQQYPGNHFSLQYGKQVLPVNSYSNGPMRSTVSPLGSYSPYGCNANIDQQYLESIPRPSSAHPSLDYPLNGYSNPYPIPQTSPIYSTAQDSYHIQSTPEANLHAQGPPVQVSPGYGLPNGCIQAATIKREPDLQIPEPKEKEDVWSDNEHNFLDPDIGGVAVAPSHGSILIECAKRELHATTPLKNPDRNHPTRISLVFYQHKNLIEAKHGLALWETKMAEKAREKEDDEKNGTESVPSKGKKGKREHSDKSNHAEPPYKRFIKTLMQRSMSCTTNSYVSTAPYAYSKVTGPYNRFI